MREAIGVILAALILAAMASAMGQGVDGPNPQPAANPPEETVTGRFANVDVYIDSGNQPLATYQFELKVRNADAAIVGVESGDIKGFQDPPFYDPAALSENRIIIGAYDTGSDLPVGKICVARVHLHLSGPGRPVYEVNVMTAGAADGSAIPARASVTEGETR